MKRVKIMFSAIAVLAIVGGALAFKAARFDTKVIWCEDAQNVCTISLTSLTDVQNNRPINNPCTTVGAGLTKYSLISNPSGTCAFSSTTLFRTAN